MNTKENALSLCDKKQLGACFASFAYNGCVVLSVGALLPFIRESYAIGYAFAGVLVSLHSIGNLISGFLTGVFSLWLGRRKSILIFSVTSILAYLMLIFGSSPFVLAVAFLFTGLGRGSISNFNNVIVNEIAPGKAWALNSLHASFAVGAFLAPFIVLGFTKNSPDSWQLMCWLMVGLAAVVFVIYAFMPMYNGTQEAPQKGQSMGFIKQSSFWLGTGTLFFYLCAEQGVIGWMITYFQDSGIMSADYAQIMASLLWLLILAGRLATAALSQRLRRSTLLAFMSIGFFAFFILILIGNSLAVITIGIIGFGFSMAGVYPTTVALSGKTIQDYPLSWSFMLTIASFGSIIMPSIVGAIADSYGIYAGISSIAAAIAVAVVFIWINVIYWRKHNA